MRFRTCSAARWGQNDAPSVSDSAVQTDRLTHRYGERIALHELNLRVEIAKGLINRPQLLLLDEPSTGLDPVARADVWRYLDEVRGKDGVTVLMTTHLMDEADRCDRVAVMDEGKLVAWGTPAELKE